MQVMFFQRSPQLAAAGRLLTGALLTGLLAGCGTQVQNAYKVQQDLSEALRLAQTKPTDAEARQWADQAIAITPQDPAVYFGSSTPSSDPLPQLSVLFVFTNVGDTPAVADYMDQATKKFPQDERGWQALVNAREQMGQTAAQHAAAARLVLLLGQKLQKPGTTDIMMLTDALAQAYFDAGDPVNGAATYTKAVQAYPTQPDPKNGLAYAYAVSGTHLPEALALAQKALAEAQQAGVSDEGQAAIQDTVGWVQYRQGDYADAAQNILQAASAAPREAEIRYHLGLIYAAQGNVPAAQAELGHAVMLAQNYAAAQQALSSLPKTSDSLPKNGLPNGAAPSGAPAAAPQAAASL